MSDFESSDSDVELQEAFAEGRLKPGLNTVHQQPKEFVNNIAGLKLKLTQFKHKLPWVEVLDCLNSEAPLAPELAAQLLINEERRGNQLRNNKKLPQIDPSVDPVLNDFKREAGFHRQAQAAVLEALPKLKTLGLATIRPEDYFAEMAKSDEQMQKVRTHLMQKEAAKQRSEKVKQLRAQKKEGKMVQVQAKLERQKDKKRVLEDIKKVRKGQSQDSSFLKGGNRSNKKSPKNDRKFRDKKFGFGGKKRGSKVNTKDSAADTTEYRRPKKPGMKGKNNRPGKNRRVQRRAKKI